VGFCCAEPPFQAPPEVRALQAVGAQEPLPALHPTRTLGGVGRDPPHRAGVSGTVTTGPTASPIRFCTRANIDTAVARTPAGTTSRITAAAGPVAVVAVIPLASHEETLGVGCDCVAGAARRQMTQEHPCSPSVVANQNERDELLHDRDSLPRRLGWSDAVRHVLDEAAPLRAVCISQDLITEVPHPRGSAEMAEVPSRLLVSTTGSRKGPPPRMITREDDVDAHALHRRGWTISAIARHLGHDRKTIRAYLHEGRVAGQRRRAEPDCLRPRPPPPYAAVSPTSYSVSSDQTNPSSPGASWPLASARQQDWTSILSTHPDLIDLDLHAARWYPDA